MKFTLANLSIIVITVVLNSNAFANPASLDDCDTPRGFFEECYTKNNIILKQAQEDSYNAHTDYVNCILTPKETEEKNRKSTACMLLADKLSVADKALNKKEAEVSGITSRCMAELKKKCMKENEELVRRKFQDAFPHSVPVVNAETSER